MVAVLRYGRYEKCRLSGAGWAHISDLRQVNTRLTTSAVMQILAEQKPDEKDRFAVMGIAPKGGELFFPWLIRANHGH
eukprot:8306289-Prorocentrum_lima.AAC.1